MAGSVAALFVLLRLWSVGDGDIGSFVGAGDLLSSQSTLPLESGAGYDGQFYYRMASAPLDFDATSNGVTLDSEVRLQRIGYPIVTWLVTLGATIPVTFGLVMVNVLGFAAIAGVGAILARHHQRNPWWGLALASYYGFAFTIAKDLTEITEVTFLLLAILAAHHRRWLPSALALSAVVLTRESAMFIVPALAIWRLWHIGRRTSRISSIDLTWMLPPIAFVAWQFIVRGGTGRFPLTAPYRHSSFNVPGWPLIRQLPDVLSDWSPRGAVHIAEVVVLLMVVILGASTLRQAIIDPFVRVTFVGLAAACFSLDVLDGVWTIRSLRMFSDVFVVATLMLIVSRRRMVVPMLATSVVSLTTYGWFLTNL
ncbi:MAG: hypothetical protein EBX95_05345 [Acidimicrobiia bacterium]|nr:hypothetical protein [Acidimicrobiia bacterium]